MAQNFEDKVASLSDRQLEDRVEKRRRFTAESVEAAIAELEKRGRIFSFAELRAIDKDLKEIRKGQAEAAAEKQHWETSEPSEVLVKEGEMPSLYSPTAIAILSILISPILGVILMAINFNKSHNKKGFWEVIVFGIVYFTIYSLSYSIILKTGVPTIYLYLFLIGYNIAGTLVLTQFFWKRYIGEGTKFQAKPVWIPLLIWVFSSLTLVLLLGLLVKEYGPGILGDTSVFKLK